MRGRARGDEAAVFAALHEPLRSLVVTSARGGEGKTRTAANLAVSLATSGKSILLVDADMRRPGQHRLFHKPLGHGLSDMILDMTEISMPSLDGSCATQYRGLSLLTCGTIPPNPIMPSSMVSLSTLELNSR